ncbi:MAG: sigma-70 family RNA polymerase sigma factor [Psychroflexus sp.]|nr:sigma-70 family RNA polymerase sigma factor [Psychroflexus sp.]MDR9448554.1 sigma-70 family RNA polymerase sigma factor [Psychroflexus sp.]
MHQLDPEKWIANYSDYLFSYTLSRVDDREKAKDIVSDTFLAALNSKDNFKGESTEKTWLVAILKRKIIDHYRKINSKKGKAEIKKGYHASEDQEGDWLEENANNEDAKNALDVIENRELGLAIEGCLESINPRQAKIFRLKTIQNMDTEVICNKMDLTPSNLWVNIHRARKALIECLGEGWTK